eukprot:4558936-Prymnesium_polylepis.1
MTIPKRVWGVAKASQTVVLFARHKSSPPPRTPVREVAMCTCSQQNSGALSRSGVCLPMVQAIEITEERAKEPRRRGDLRCR